MKRKQSREIAYHRVAMASRLTPKLRSRDRRRSTFGDPFSLRRR
jgi:hypothetical protein